MAEKKYIGKPGKQDDPCWKGYEMVGMKKKGGRQVPNCVPEATDIIAKAKAAVAKKAGAKLKMDPDTGTPDHFTAAQRRKKGLDEAKKEHYPREGFPEEGDYGYHPNPGLKPQESDSDEDMDVAYKKATEKEGRKPLNAKIIEGVTNPEIKKAYADLIKTPSGSSERKSAIRRYKSLRQNAVKEEVEGKVYSVHVKGDSKDHNSSEFKKHLKGWGGELHYASDKGAAYKFKKEYQATGFHHGVKSGFKSLDSEHDGQVKEELEEAYGMWKVDFSKQHAGKAVAAGSVHVKAQNTAHAHKVAAKRVGVDHKMFKSTVTKSSILPEEAEQLDELSKKTIASYSDKAFKSDVHLNRAQDRKTLKKQTKREKGIKTAYNKYYGRNVKVMATEELGKDNEWGTDALRKKYAAMTPGQESMAADKIPSFDPRYDNVTTQYCGGIREGYLAEISARGAEARAKFQAKVRQTLADPANIKRAKKTLAKRKEAEKAKEPAHLVMQLRKAVSIGSKVHFQDGSHHAITGNHADIFMSKYNSAKSSIEKEALQKRAHKSHSEFMRTIAEDHSPYCEPMDNMGANNVDSYEAHRGSGEQISPVISHDDEDIRFQDFDETAFEKELEADVLALSWDDMVDLYDEDEIEYDDSPEEEGEDLEEGITPAGRLKKRFNAMRSKSRRMMARNIAIKRVSSPEKLKSRSIRAARRMVYKRLLRNRDISTVSSSEKTRLEAQIKRMAPMVARLSVRVMPAVRKLEQSRIKNSRMRKRK